MHETIDEQGAWLRRVMMGFNAYHAVPTNAGTLGLSPQRRRSMAADAVYARPKGEVTWERMTVVKIDGLQDRESHTLGQQTFRRQTPEMGARCGNSARRALRGGHPATDVPTAILQEFRTI